MDLLHHLMLGFGVAFTWQNLGYCFAGCFLGLLMAVLPGIGPLAAMAMLLPVAYGLPPVAALIMLAGLYCGAQYGGSITAILVNRQDEAPSAVTAVDGSQMARRGRAGPALASAAVGAFLAGCVGAAVLAVLAPPLTELAARFGPAEYFSLMVLGLIGAAVLASGSLLKAIGMVIIGLMLGLVGTDASSGTVRFAFDLPELADGIHLVPLALGIFGYGEIMAQLSRTDQRREVFVSRVSGRMSTGEDARRMAPAILRGTALGSVLGILPGGGTVLSSFAAYTLEKMRRLCAGELPFGQGNIRAVAGPEAAGNAGVQTSFAPMLALGIPLHPVMALMMGALLPHHIQPGPQVMAGNPELFWGLVASLWGANLMLVALHLPLVGIWARLLAVPYRWLFPCIVLLGALGVYFTGQRQFDVWALAAFGFIGYLFHALELEAAPLLLGLVLGPMMEQNLRQALLLSRGDWGVLFTRPLSAGLLIAAALMVAVVLVPAVSQKRREAFVEK